MSSVVISGDTSGAITLSAPAVAGTNTITLPAATGTVVLTGTTPTLNGITFPATQVPSADANTLDDYEEGTWTPSVTSSGGSITTKTVVGSYTKIGRAVTVTFSCTLTTVGTASGTMEITGFPFANAIGYQSPTLAREQNNTGTYYQAFINPSPSTTGALRGQTDAAISWSNGSIYDFTLTYFTT